MTPHGASWDNGHKSGHSGLFLSLKRLVYTQKVTGSSPVPPTILTCLFLATYDFAPTWFFDARHRSEVTRSEVS